MKTVKVKREASDHQVAKNQLSFRGIKFAWCSEPFLVQAIDLEPSYIQATHFYDCRETLASCMKSKVDPNNIYAANGNNNVDVNKLRILVYMKKYSKTKKEAKMYEDQADGFMENALKAIRFFERYAGWKPTSKVYKVDMGLSFKCYIYLFEADSKWIKSPHMISLYTLLVRCGKFSEISNIHNYAHFVKIVRTLLNKKRKARKERGKKLRLLKKYSIPIEEEVSRFYKWPCPNNNDVEHLYYVSRKLNILLKNYNELFGAKTIKDTFRYTTSTEGIKRLCRNNSTMKEVREQFGKLCEDKNVSLKVELPDNE